MRAIFTTLLCSLGLTAAAFAATPVPAPPELPARSYILMDFDSGRILAQKSAESQLEPASITKIMTTYVAFQELANGALKLDDKVRVSERARNTPGSRMFINTDERILVETLLKGIIVQSGNDASVALAEHIAGTEQTFAALMNQYAHRLGMYGTHFANSTGLPDANHYSTAHDIAIMSRAMIRDFPEYYLWYSEREFQYGDITQYNRNKLLWRDDTVDGIKTGHTSSAGYCLVASAKRDEMRLISVVLGTNKNKTRLSASQALLNYGFRFYETHKVHGAGEPIRSTRVWKGDVDAVSYGVQKPLFVTIPRGQYGQIEREVNLLPQLTAPLAREHDIGMLRLSLNGEELAEAPLVTLEPVSLGSFWSRLVDEARLFFE